jgi:hypothetical protein
MCRIVNAPNFKLSLTRVIEPTGDPGVELTTLDDAARFVGLASGAATLGFRGRVALEGRRDRKEKGR